MDRSNTPKLSQQPQARRQNTRSRSGSVELNQLIEQGATARAKPTIRSPSMSASSSSSGISSPVTPIPDRLNSPGVIGWVRNALLLGSTGRSTPTSQSSPRSTVQPIDSLNNSQDTPLMPGSIPFYDLKDDDLQQSLAMNSVRSSFSLESPSSADHSSWNIYDRSQRRMSSVSSVTTIEDELSSSSSDEDVYCPFSTKERRPSVVQPTARRDGSLSEPAAEVKHFSNPLANQSNVPFNASHSLSSRAGGSHLSLREAQDAHQFVQDTTTTTAQPMPSLVLTPPDSSPKIVCPASPIAGWMEPQLSISQRPGIDRRQSDNKTPVPRDTQSGPPMVSADNSNRLQSFANERRRRAEDGSIQGDGEDLEDFLGRPRSPEELANTRPSKESIVLGSRGVGYRSIGSVTSGRIPSEDRGLQKATQPEEWDGAQSKTPLGNAPSKGTENSSEAVSFTQVQQALVDKSITQTASPQPRRAINFFNRRREASIGANGAPEVEKQENGKKDTSATNQPTFWRLGKRQSNVSASNSNTSVGARREVNDKTKVNKNKADDRKGTLEVQSLSKRSSQESGRSAGSDVPKKGFPRVDTIDSTTSSTGKGTWNSRRKLGVGLLGSSMQPRSIKVRRTKKTSKERDFARLYLAQELFLESTLEESKITSNANGEENAKPALSHLDSSASVASSLASSTSTFNSASGQTKRKATWAMKFSLDGKHLAVAGQDTTIRVYAVLESEEARRKVELDSAIATETLLASPAYHDTAASTCSVNSVGKKLSNRKSMNGKEIGKTTTLPNLAVFNPVPIREFKGHTSDILDLSWSKGGFLLSASMDKTARVWHLSRATSLVSFVHGDFVTSAVFHPRDDRFFLSGSLDGKLRLWNITAKRVQSSQEVPGLITACAFTETGNTACVGTFAGHALFYQTEGLIYSSSIAVRSPSGKHSKGGRKITSIEPLISHESAISSGSKGGERILVTSNDSRVRAYDLKNKSMIARFKARTYANRTSQIRANVSDDNLFVVAGSEATTCHEGGQVHIWNSSSHLFDSGKKLLSKMKSTGTGANKMVVAPSVSTDCNVEYFSAHAGTVTCAIMAPLKINSHLRISQDHIVKESDRRLAMTKSPSLTGLTNALSAGVYNPLKLATGNGESGGQLDHRRLNRIIVSVDESAVVRVWRSDSLNTVEG